MSIQVTFTFENAKYATALIRYYQEITGDDGVTVAATPAPTSAPPAPKATAAPTPAPTSAPASATDKPITYETSGLAPLIQQAAGKDRNGTVALLKKFGANKGAEIKPEQFEEFRAAITAFIAG